MLVDCLAFFFIFLSARFSFRFFVGAVLFFAFEGDLSFDMVLVFDILGKVG